MNDFSDQQLLRDYAARRSEPAFAELVRRHVDHVHTAALRMVCDAHLAEDVTQGAFVALAQNAGSLTDHAVLSGWLHRTAQNLAANAVRTEVRRRARETEAVAMNDIFSAEPDARWEDIAPHLDAALGELGEADRDALLLRYFERKSASEMAHTLGISDEAAQKRVNRAVEKLRDIFTKRKITVGAGGLVAVISGNAVQAAPAGLALKISVAAALAGTAVHTTTIIAATKTIATTTLQKTAITAALIAAAGAGIFEARQAAQLRAQNQILHQAQAPLAEQNQQLQTERGSTMTRLAGLLAENARLKSDPNHDELLKLRAEVTQLRPLLSNVVALQKLASQSVIGLPEWKPDQVKNVGRSSPLDALQTYIWSAKTTNSLEILNSLIADNNDPPLQDALAEYIGDGGNHLFNDAIIDYRIFSQILVSPDEAHIELSVRFGNNNGPFSRVGVTAPITLRSVNGVWKVVVFNKRDKDGKITQLGFST